MEANLLGEGYAPFLRSLFSRITCSKGLSILPTAGILFGPIITGGGGGGGRMWWGIINLLSYKAENEVKITYISSQVSQILI